METTAKTAIPVASVVKVPIEKAWKFCIHPIEIQRGGWQAILDNFKKYSEANQ